MSQPHPVQILSDDDEDEEQDQIPIPIPPIHSKKRKSEEFEPSNLVILDDDPTPKKSISVLSTPSHVSDTPMSDSDPFKSDFSISKCTTRFSDPNLVRSLPDSAFDIEETKKSSGGGSLICLESDNESAGDIREIEMTEREHVLSAFDFGDNAVHDECFMEYANSKDRNYVTVKSRTLHPEFRGRMVSAFLGHHFTEVTDYSFTADMETELDNVSAGMTEWKGLLKDYWTRFKAYCDRAGKVDIRQVEKMLQKTFEDFLFSSLPNRTCPSCSEGKLVFKTMGWVVLLENQFTKGLLQLLLESKV